MEFPFIHFWIEILTSFALFSFKMMLILVLCSGVAVHQAINNSVGSILPSELQKTILDGIFTLGRAQLSDFVLNENNPLGSSRLSKVRRIFEGGESLQLQFPAEDLGFRYGFCVN